MIRVIEDLNWGPLADRRRDQRLKYISRVTRAGALLNSEAEYQSIKLSRPRTNKTPLLKYAIILPGKQSMPECESIDISKLLIVVFHWFCVRNSWALMFVFTRLCIIQRLYSIVQECAATPAIARGRHPPPPYISVLPQLEICCLTTKQDSIICNWFIRWARRFALIMLIVVMVYLCFGTGVSSWLITQCHWIDLVNYVKNNHSNTK